jgi:alpha-tubulin suppressor-like RCC1 family protein
VVALAPGGNHSLVLRADGSVLAWGSNLAGELGDGAPHDREHAPVGVSGLGAGSGVVALASGTAHTLAVRADGSVLGWGWDEAGQLGDGGANANQSTPVAVSGLGPGSGVVAASGGYMHSLARRADGSVVAWGGNLAGQLGHGVVGAGSSTPVAVSGLAAGSGVVAVSAGQAHSLARRSDGSVLAWGSDAFGQLGDGGANADQPAPVTVSGLGAGSGVVAVAAGSYHSLAVRGDGSVLAWGNDISGQLGDGFPASDKTTPVAVSGLGAGSGVVAVAAGGFHSLALRSNGSVLAWGEDGKSQLGDGGPFLGIDQPAPVSVSGLGVGSGVVAVTAGIEHSMALHANGTALAWGSDGFGEVGDGNASNGAPVPVPVRGLGLDGGIVVLSAGGFHSLAVSTVPRVVSDFAPLTPARVWDTRFGPGQSGLVGPGQVREVAVTGTGGVPIAGVTAVVLNVTAINPSAGTYLTVWPTGQPRPLASNLNVPPGDTRANLVTVKVGTGGKVSVYNDAGTTDIVADVSGWYGPAANQGYLAVSPARFWDTRVGPGPTGQVGPGQSRDVQLTGSAGVPASGATAVAVNVTAVTPTAGTFVTVWPAGEPKPLASNINLPAGDTRPNLVIVKLGAGGLVSFANDAGATHLVADVVGYYHAEGGSLFPTAPERVYDSRPFLARAGAGEVRQVTVAGVYGVSASQTTAVVLNVTAVNPSAGTFVTVWPGFESKPLASNLNIPPGDTRANLVMVAVGGGGTVSFSSSAGSVDIVVDIVGWITSGIGMTGPPTSLR